MYICDRFEQKQADGWVLTNPLNTTALRPGSTFIDGFSKLIPQRIAVEIIWYIPLENPSVNVEPGRNSVAFSGFDKTHLADLLLLEAVTYYVYVYILYP